MIDKYATVHNRIRKLARAIKQSKSLAERFNEADKKVDEAVGINNENSRKVRNALFSPFIQVPGGILIGGNVGRGKNEPFNPYGALIGGSLGLLNSQLNDRYNRALERLKKE